MLNKDQYDQDEYNDYYAQEIRGAEISGGSNEGNTKKIVFIFLLLLLIIALAYFGWKSMNNSNTSTNTKKVDIQSKELVENKSQTTKPMEQEKVATTQKDDITKKIESIASSNSKEKMSQEEIANIVKMVMKTINKQNEQSSTTNSSKKLTDEEIQDKKLVKSLKNSEVDSLSAVKENIDTISETDKTKQASSSDTPNTYNKVVLTNKSESSGGGDELSKLSEEISNVIGSEEDTVEKDNTGYTKSIVKEVKTRKKEMRYVTVRKGDTLGKIAKRVYGNVMAYKKIYEANPDILRRPDRIYIGQKLRIPE